MEAGGSEVEAGAAADSAAVVMEAGVEVEAVGWEAAARS